MRASSYLKGLWEEQSHFLSRCVQLSMSMFGMNVGAVNSLIRLIFSLTFSRHLTSRSSTFNSRINFALAALIIGLKLTEDISFHYFASLYYSSSSSRFAIQLA